MPEKPEKYTQSQILFSINQLIISGADFTRLKQTFGKDKYPYFQLINAVRVSIQGVTFPAMMAMWARWAPPLERSRLMTLSGSGASFGAFLALPLTGYICQTLGWPAVFYICGE